MNNPEKSKMNINGEICDCLISKSCILKYVIFSNNKYINPMFVIDNKNYIYNFQNFELYIFNILINFKCFIYNPEKFKI